MVGVDEILARYRSYARQPLRALTLAFALACLPPASHAQDASAATAPPQTCTKTEFEAVVDEAGEALRNLNQEKKPDFQDRLRQLKDKRGWSHDEFLKAAAPFVKDDQIDVYDTKSNELLENISLMGQDSAAATPLGSQTPDCAVLLELRAQMKVLVETQNAKWAYMFGKLDGELQK
jgi:hypothetical protein